MEHQHTNGNTTAAFDDNEFFNAIMDEDVARVESFSKTYGSNFLLKGLAVVPIHLAASYRRGKSMQSLLSAGADPELRDQLGRTTLHLVITSWPRIQTNSQKTNSTFRTAVMDARRQTKANLRLLCEHGVDINAQVEGVSHQTALHLSVRYAAVPAVHILASYGADVNAMDSSGMTALHMAAGILHKDIMASLIKEEADINMGVKHSGNTPLHLAAMAMAMKTARTLEDDISCVCELLDGGAEVDAVNKAGRTPLQEACSVGNEDLVELLLRYGADINRPSQTGESCLFLFLNHRPNVRNHSLLLKLLSLTNPLAVYNQSGHLPSTLTLPCFFKQRDHILQLAQQPRRLQDICKCVIYLKHVPHRREAVKLILPERLYDFVCNHWDNVHGISFVMDDEQDYSEDLFGMPTPS